MDRVSLQAAAAQSRADPIDAYEERSMADIIVYATRNGHSRALALDLGKRLGAQVAEIGDLVKRRGPFGWLKSGRQAAMGLATPIRDPGVALGSVAKVVIVQPVWASAVCPPVRSWIKAHAKELAGKKVGLLASCYGTPAAILRAKFDSEFGPEIGALAACATIQQKDEAEIRASAFEAFLAELGSG
jgi:hypothetical protein